jgi:hypothetical protein
MKDPLKRKADKTEARLCVCLSMFLIEVFAK